MAALSVLLFDNCGYKTNRHAVVSSVIISNRINSDTSKVASLPENFGNLVNLKTLDISHTNISSLPDSIWGLTLENLDMSGTSIK